MHPGIPVLSNDLGAVIGRTIIPDNQFPISEALRHNAVECLAQERGAIANIDDDADQGHEGFAVATLILHVRLAPESLSLPIGTSHLSANDMEHEGERPSNLRSYGALRK